MNTRFVSAQKGAIFACALTILGALHPSEAVEAAGLFAYQSQGGRAISLFLRGDTLNDGFNGMSVVIKPDGGAAFANVNPGLTAGVPRQAGQAFTYRNRALDFDPLDPEAPGVGKGWTILSPINSASEISFAGGPLGKQINTATEPRSELFLANLYLIPGTTFSAQLTLVNGVDTVFTQGFSLPLIPLTELPPLPEVPEPSSAALLVTAGLAAVVAQRHRMSRV
ncbi:PEP-CTERM sorting domain-containing protein [Lacipirellula sp.]|uniref:PEP-CTERM sorting domain-containing protein n=1 Tax=Lacipirellula sp. TaxID=2691419 RepID=UPI003D10E0D4